METELTPLLRVGIGFAYLGGALFVAVGALLGLWEAPAHE